MSNLGNLVQTLIMDTSRYSEGSQRAVSETRSAQRAVQSLIADLERQRDAMSGAGSGSDLLALADRGASVASVEYAQTLRSEVDALKQAQRAQAEANAEKKRVAEVSQRAVDGLVNALNRERDALMGTTKTLDLQALAEKGASSASVDHAVKLRSEVDALRLAKQAYDDTQAEMQRVLAVSNNLVNDLQQQAATWGMTANQARLFTATQNGVTREATEAAYALETQARAQRKLDAHVQAQIRAQQGANDVQAGATRGSMVLTESIRGLEDAVAGYTNNGLKGMLQATTNNVTQIGAMIGGSAGLYLSMASIGGLIGVSLVPMLMKWAEGLNTVREAERKLAEEQRTNHERYMSMIDERFARQAARQDDEKRVVKLIRDPNTKPEQIRQEQERLEQAITQDHRRQAAERIKLDEMEKREAFLREQQRASVGVNEMDAEQKKELEKELKSIEEQRIKSQEARKQAQRDEQQHKDLLKQTQAAAPVVDALAARKEAEKKDSEWVKEEEEKAKKKKEIEEKLQKEIAAIRQQFLETTDPAEAKFQKAVQNTISSLKDIEQARKAGLITDAQAAELEKQTKETQANASVEKPQAVGGTAAIAAGTAAAISAVFKAQRQAEANKELKDLQQEQLNRLNDLVKKPTINVQVVEI